MKILQINKFLKIVGGAETYMFQLAKALQNEGHIVKFWGMSDPENLVNDFPDLLANNIDYSNQGLVSKLSSSINTIYSKDNRKKIAKVLGDFQPDIVHIHNYNFQLTPSILPEIKKRGIKVVQTVHDSQMVCPYHRLYNFQQDTICTKCVTGSFTNCIKDKCFDGSILKSSLGAFESMFYHKFKYYEKYIDLYISPSKFLKSVVSKRINAPIKVIPNFTEVEQTTKDIKNKKSYYLYYGRISDEKGILEIIDIFKEIKLKLLIIGKGPIENKVNEAITDSNSIQFIGPKYGEKLFEYVQNAKYIVQSSKWYENCPMTIIEAFALKVPVIGSNHSGFKDLITNGKTGFLIDFTDKENSIKKMKKVDIIDVVQLKNNVNMFYANNLSKKIHLNKILSIYQNLLK